MTVNPQENRGSTGELVFNGSIGFRWGEKAGI